MPAIAPITAFMGGKQPPDKVPVKPAKTPGKPVVDAKPKKRKRLRTPLAGYGR